MVHSPDISLGQGWPRTQSDQLAMRRGLCAPSHGSLIPVFDESVHIGNIGAIPMAKKQSSSKTSTLASKVLSGAKKPTPAEAKKLAASVLSQDEKKGQKK